MRFDVHMTDLFAQRTRLEDYQGLVICGGFSYGDVLGAGEGWAKSILFHSRLRDEFSAFFARSGNLLAWCLQRLPDDVGVERSLIPGTEHWPRFVRNRSEQFEGRLSLVEVMKSPSLFFAGMEGSRMPIAVAHGEGLAEFAKCSGPGGLCGPTAAVVAFRGQCWSRNGALSGKSERVTAGCHGHHDTADGRVTLTMPHPERVYRTAQHSWHPEEWGEDSPWMRIFRNARVWVG